MQGTDPATADSLCQILSLVKDSLDQGARERYALVQVAELFRVGFNPFMYATAYK